jgi:hypothetical protein
VVSSVVYGGGAGAVAVSSHGSDGETVVVVVSEGAGASVAPIKELSCGGAGGGAGESLEPSLSDIACDASCIDVCKSDVCAQVSSSMLKLCTSKKNHVGRISNILRIVELTIASQV